MARRTKQQIEEDNKLLDEIRTSISNNPKAVCKAIRILHGYQTEEERLQHATTRTNGVGFSAMDANFGSFLYEVIQRDGTLKGKLLEQGRRLAMKYAKTQLFAVAKAKQNKAS